MNLSSSAAEIGSPMFTVYNATKVTIFQVCYMYMCTKLIIVHHMTSVCACTYCLIPRPCQHFDFLMIHAGRVWEQFTCKPNTSALAAGQE